MSLQEEELVSSHAGQTDQASSLLDQIMAQTRIQPGSEGYDVARQGVTAFIASILQSTASAEPVNKLAVDSMIADIDERISRQMDVIIHAPAFQQVESFWRSLKTMVDRVDFRENIKVNVLHVTKQELLEDFEFAPEIIQSGFYKHVYSSGFGQFGGEPIAAVLGAYEFKNTAPDMKLLQYVSAVGAMAHAPFLSSVSPEFMELNSWTELPNIKDLYAIFEGPAYTKWRALRDSEDSRYLGLTAPRFLLRQPYSPTDNPVKNFNYYEDVSQNHEDYLWGNTAWMLACNIADSFAKYRWCPNIIGPQSGGAVKICRCICSKRWGRFRPKSQPRCWSPIAANLNWLKRVLSPLPCVKTLIMQPFSLQTRYKNRSTFREKTQKPTISWVRSFLISSSSIG